MAAGSEGGTFHKGAGGWRVHEANPRDPAWPFPISLSSQAALLCHLLLVTSQSLRAAPSHREGSEQLDRGEGEVPLEESTRGGIVLWPSSESVPVEWSLCSSQKSKHSGACTGPPSLGYCSCYVGW